MHLFEELMLLLLFIVTVSAKSTFNITDTIFNFAKRSPYFDINEQEGLFCNVRDFSAVGDGITDDTG